MAEGYRSRAGKGSANRGHAAVVTTAIARWPARSRASMRRMSSRAVRASGRLTSGSSTRLKKCRYLNPIRPISTQAAAETRRRLAAPLRAALG